MKSLALKKQCGTDGTFFAEGLQAATVALDERFDIKAVMHASELADTRTASAFVERCHDGSERHRVVTLNACLRRPIRTQSYQWRQRGHPPALRQSSWSLPPRCPVCLLALKDPQYARNLGTILRSCANAREDSLVLLESSVDPYDLDSA